MNGYVTFLKSLTENQQWAEIARLAFSERNKGSSLEEDILKHETVATFSESLGVKPTSWKLDLKHYLEEPEFFGCPVFNDNGECETQFAFLYHYLDQGLLVPYHYLTRGLLVTGAICVDDDGKGLIRIIGCQAIPTYHSRSPDRLRSLGLDPDTLETSSHKEMSGSMPYLDYLRILTPAQQNDAVFDLTELAWGPDYPYDWKTAHDKLKFLSHPKLAPELERLGISEPGEADKSHEVGPVEFYEGRCTAPLAYHLYGDGEASKHDEGGDGYYLEIHLLAGITNKPSGGADISIEDACMRTQLIDDPADDSIPVILD
jgi:hypothetical protein